MKKLILTIAIIALLSLTFVFAVSASEYDFISTNDDNPIIDGYLTYSTFDYEVSDGDNVSIIYIENGNTMWFQPYSFKVFVDTIMGSNGDCEYSIFIESCNYIISSDSFEDQYSLRQFCGYWYSNYYGFDEACFNKFYYYKEITQEDLDEKDNIIAQKDEQIAGMANSLDIIDGMYQNAHSEIVKLQTENSTLTTQVEQLQSSVENLTVENTNLHYEKEMLNQQVTDLVNEKTTINSELMAMEAKLEREKSKAYLQGYEDADGFSWLPIIACLSVVSILSTVISIALRARKKKR